MEETTFIKGVKTPFARGTVKRKVGEAAMCPKLLSDRSIPARVVGLASEEFPLVVDIAEDGAPERFILLQIEHIGHQRADDPGVSAEFFFQLTACPPGIAEEGAQVHAVLRLEFERFLRIDAKHELEAGAFRVEAPSAQEQAISIDRT